MIKLNAKGDHVEVSIAGSNVDIARELHALINTINTNEAMQVAMMTAIAVDAISEEEHRENDGLNEVLKRILGKGTNNESLKS